MSHCLSGRPGGLGVPEVEATDVELHGLLVCPDALYHELAALNGRVTGEAHLAMAVAAPDLREALLRQASIGELFSNEMTDAFEFQGGPPGLRQAPTPDSPCLNASRASTRKARVQAW